MEMGEISFLDIDKKFTPGSFAQVVTKNPQITKKAGFYPPFTPRENLNLSTKAVWVCKDKVVVDVDFNEIYVVTRLCAHNFWLLVNVESLFELIAMFRAFIYLFVSVC